MKRSPISQILYWQGDFPKEAIAHLIDDEEASRPILRGCLEATLATYQSLTEDYVGAIYAAYILAFFRDTKAFPLLIQLLELPEGYPERLFKECLLQSFPKVLASCYDGNLALLTRLIASPRAYLPRLVALVSLSILYRVKKLAKEDLLALMRTLLAGPQDPLFLANIAEEIADLHLYELEDEVIGLYKASKIDATALSLEQFKKLIHADFSNPEKYFLIEDVFEELTGREYEG